MNRRRVASTSTSGPARAISVALIGHRSLLALVTQLPGGRCLTQIGRAGSRTVLHTLAWQGSPGVWISAAGGVGKGRECFAAGRGKGCGSMSRQTQRRRGRRRASRPAVAPSGRGSSLTGSEGKFIPALVIGAGLYAYYNSLRGPFIFDDLHAVLNNPTIRQLWPLLTEFAVERRMYLPLAAVIVLVVIGWRMALGEICRRLGWQTGRRRVVEVVVLLAVVVTLAQLTGRRNEDYRSAVSF